MTSFVLVFGIFFTLSCASLLSSGESAEDLYNKSNYNAALEKVDRELADDPQNHQLTLLKTQILSDYAVNERSPADRELIYQNLRSTADELRYSTDLFSTETDSILKSAWAHEQGEGVRYLQQEDNRDIDRVISHFSNAITIIPDSIVTYNLKATTHYRNNEVGKAIETLESIEEAGFNRPAETEEKLAYLYLEAGMIDKSIEIYEQLTVTHPENEVFRQGLANAYILGERHQQSTELLKQLAEEYPNRAEYREALATERFFLLKIEVRNQIDALEINEEEADQYISSIRELATMFKEIDDTLPASEERSERIAEFHIGASSLLIEMAEILDPESELSDKISEEADTHLRDSIPHLRSLYESSSDNVAYAQRLIRVYNMLNMEHEAENLERQINF